MRIALVGAGLHATVSPLPAWLANAEALQTVAMPMTRIRARSNGTIRAKIVRRTQTCAIEALAVARALVRAILVLARLTTVAREALAFTLNACTSATAVVAACLRVASGATPAR